MDSGTPHKGSVFSNATSQYRFASGLAGPSNSNNNNNEPVRVAYPSSKPTQQQTSNPKYKPSLFSHVVSTATGSQDRTSSLASSSSFLPQDGYSRKNVGGNSADNHQPQRLKVSSAASHIILDHPSSHSSRDDHMNHQSGPVSIRAKPAAPILYIGKGARIARPQAPSDPESVHRYPQQGSPPAINNNGYARPQNRQPVGMPLNSATAVKFFQSAGLKVRKSNNSSDNSPLAILPSTGSSPSIPSDLGNSPGPLLRKTSGNGYPQPDNGNRSFSSGVMKDSRSPSPYNSRASYPMSNTNSRSTSSSGSQLLVTASGKGSKISPMVTQRRNDYYGNDDLDQDHSSEHNSFDDEFDLVADEYDRELEQELENELNYHENESDSNNSFMDNDNNDFGQDRIRNKKNPILLKVPTAVMPPGSKLAISSEYSGQQADEVSTKKFNDLQAKQARSNRKMMDLEISNASLMKVNKYLEKKIRNQAKNAQKEMLAEKRKSLFGKPIAGLTKTLSKDEIGGNDQERRSVIDNFDSNESTNSDSDVDSEVSEENDQEDFTFDATNKCFEENDLAEKTRLVEERTQSHIKFLKSSETVNKQIRDCLFMSEALLEQAKQSLSFEIDADEVRLEAENQKSKSFEDLEGSGFGELSDIDDNTDDEKFEGLGASAKFRSFGKLTEQEDEGEGASFSDIEANITNEEEDEEYSSDQSFEYKNRTQEYASFLPLDVMEEIEQELDEMMIEDSDTNENSNKDDMKNHDSDDSKCNDSGINSAASLPEISEDGTNLTKSEMAFFSETLDSIKEENTQELKETDLAENAKSSSMEDQEEKSSTDVKTPTIGSPALSQQSNSFSSSPTSPSSHHHLTPSLSALVSPSRLPVSSAHSKLLTTQNTNN